MAFGRRQDPGETNNGYRSLNVIEVPPTPYHGNDNAAKIIGRNARPRLPIPTQRDFSLIGQLEGNVFERQSSRLVADVLALTPGTIPLAGALVTMFHALGKDEPTIIAVDTRVADADTSHQTRANEISRLRDVMRGRRVTIIDHMSIYPYQTNTTAQLARAAGASSLAAIEGAWWEGLGELRIGIADLRINHPPTEERMVQIGARCAVQYVDFLRNK